MVRQTSDSATACSTAIQLTSKLQHIENQVVSTAQTGSVGKLGSPCRQHNSCRCPHFSSSAPAALYNQHMDLRSACWSTSLSGKPLRRCWQRRQQPQTPAPLAAPVRAAREPPPMRSLRSSASGSQPQYGSSGTGMQGPRTGMQAPRTGSVGASPLTGACCVAQAGHVVIPTHVMQGALVGTSKSRNIQSYTPA